MSSRRLLIRNPTRRAAPSSERRERLSDRRRRSRIRTALFLACILLILGGGVSALSYHPRVNISSIDVSGVQALSADTIRAVVEHVIHDGALHLVSRSNIFFYPGEEMRRALHEKFPRIRSVVVSREALLAQTVRVHIEERAAFALWCDTECFLMDENGFIFASADGATASGYIFSGGLNTNRDTVGQTYLPGHFKQIRILLALLSEQGLRPHGLTVENEKDFSIPLESGFSIRASFSDEPEHIVERLVLALSSEVIRGREHLLEYVDLRFGSKVFYRLRDREEHEE